VNPAYLYVPIYSPGMVYFPPRPGIVVGFAIHFAPSIYIGPAFVPYGWAHPGFGGQPCNLCGRSDVGTHLGEPVTLMRMLIRMPIIRADRGR
jgi:hypothetical protein